MKAHCQNQAVPLTSNIYQKKFGENKRKEVKETLEFVSAMQDEKPWEEELELMFPGSSIESIKKAICKATSPNEAAEILYVQDPVTYDSIESLVDDFGSNKDNDKSYTLCIDREELWRGALGFYKKALSDKTLLLKDLIIVFKGRKI